MNTTAQSQAGSSPQRAGATSNDDGRRGKARPGGRSSARFRIFISMCLGKRSLACGGEPERYVTGFI